MNNNQKTYLIYKYLLENTDYSHTKTYTDIKEYLESFNESLDHKTLLSILEFLKNDLGVDLIRKRTSIVEYYIGKRDFENGEIKALLDAVSSAKFISKAKTKELQEKLLKSFSVYDRAKFKSSIVIIDSLKITANLNNKIDLINKAIINRNTIQFKYMTYMIKKGRVPKHNGLIYTISPYWLVCNNDRYYLIGYSFKDNEIRNYRVDRIGNIMINDSLKYKPLIGKITSYINEAFNMFNGENRRVILKCRNSLLDSIIDKFGYDNKISEIDSEYFSIEVNVLISPTFFSWIIGFAGDIQILDPKDVIEEFDELLKKFR